MQMLQCPFDIQTLFLSTTQKTYLFADKGVESVQLLLEECVFESEIYLLSLVWKKVKITQTYTYTVWLNTVSF